MLKILALFLMPCIYGGVNEKDHQQAAERYHALGRLQTAFSR